MTDLIHRLEHAEPGQERELDAEIALACGWGRCTDEEGIEYWFPPSGSKTPSHVRRPYRFGDYSEHREALPRFTVSVDAAMMLVPEGLLWTIGPGCDPDVIAWQDGWVCAIIEAPHVASPRDCEGRGATPALAICVVALRARSSNNGL